MQRHGDLGGFADIGGEVDKVGFELCEGPGEEEDLCGGFLLFCCADDSGYGFEVILFSISNCHKIDLGG